MKPSDNEKQMIEPEKKHNIIVKNHNIIVKKLLGNGNMNWRFDNWIMKDPDVNPDRNSESRSK